MSEPKLSKTVFVTGDSSGIGAAVCARLSAAGWQVYGASRREPEHRDPGTKAWTHLSVDVTDEASVANAINHVSDDAGRLDAVVLCAGQSFASPVEEASIEEAKSHLDVNFHGAVRVLRAALPIMRQQGHGKIIVVGSIGGLIGLPFFGYYSAAKFALDGLIESMRPEIAPFGIDASIVHPGAVDTKISLNRISTRNSDETSPYYGAFQRNVAFHEATERDGCSPDYIARHIEGLLNRRRMPVRSVAGQILEKLGVFAKRVMISRHFEYLMSRAYGPGKDAGDKQNLNR